MHLNRLARLAWHAAGKCHSSRIHSRQPFTAQVPYPSVRSKLNTVGTHCCSNQGGCTRRSWRHGAVAVEVCCFVLDGSAQCTAYWLGGIPAVRLELCMQVSVFGRVPALFFLITLSGHVVRAAHGTIGGTPTVQPSMADLRLKGLGRTSYGTIVRSVLCDMRHVELQLAVCGGCGAGPCTYGRHVLHGALGTSSPAQPTTYRTRCVCCARWHAKHAVARITAASWQASCWAVLGTSILAHLTVP